MNDLKNWYFLRQKFLKCMDIFAVEDDGKLCTTINNTHGKTDSNLQSDILLQDCLNGSQGNLLWYIITRIF